MQVTLGFWVMVSQLLLAPDFIQEAFIAVTQHFLFMMVNKVAVLFYQLIYQIVFVLVSIYLASQLVLQRLKYRFLCLFNLTRDDCAFIQQCSWEKRPNHLGIILTEDNIYLQELSKLICWSVAAGIKCISVFEKQG